ncbi:hypothetical protein BH20GEM2_BH20GEM2_01500 [soil metagenome]
MVQEVNDLTLVEYQANRRESSAGEQRLWVRQTANTLCPRPSRPEERAEGVGAGALLSGIPAESAQRLESVTGLLAERS